MKSRDRKALDFIKVFLPCPSSPCFSAKNVRNMSEYDVVAVTRSQVISFILPSRPAPSPTGVRKVGSEPRRCDPKSLGFLW